MGSTVAVTGGSGKLGRAVIHLAAIPGAGGFPNVAILENNLLSTFHVFQAAARLAKDLEERMALHYCRWDPELKMIGLRFSNVIDPSEYAQFPTFEDDPASRKWNLWTYIDARDGAQAVVQALNYPTRGFDKFVIANHDNVMTRSSADLMAEFFPNTEFRTPIEGTQSLININKARRGLNWKPTHSWRNEVSG